VLVVVLVVVIVVLDLPAAKKTETKDDYEWD
jgi:hypothetical protein